jgi:hypothetical protein
MRGIVLPFTALNVGSISTLNICVAIEVVIHVDVDVVAAPAATPTPTAAPRGAHRQTYAKRDRARRNHCACRRVSNWRVRIYRRPVYNRRVVRGHIDDLRIRLFDHNDLLARNRLGLNVHLLVVLQRSSALSFRSHALNGIHYVTLLRQKGVAQIGGPLNVICQEFDDIWQRRHRLNAWIPRLFLDCLS